MLYTQLVLIRAQTEGVRGLKQLRPLLHKAKILCLFTTNKLFELTGLWPSHA